MMKLFFTLCLCLLSVPSFAESALNLAPYKTIKDLYNNLQASDEIKQRLGKEGEKLYDSDRPYRQFMTFSVEKGIIYTTKNGLYFGKLCLQGTCDMFIQEKGHEPIIIIDVLGESFYIFFKNPLSQYELNKILAETQLVILDNEKKAKKFTVKLHFFNQ